MTLAVAAGAVTIRTSSNKRKKKKESGTPTDASSSLHLPVQRAPCKGALAYRRSTTVLT
jgi:hypothetical protein